MRRVIERGAEGDGGYRREVRVIVQVGWEKVQEEEDLSKAKHMSAIHIPASAYLSEKWIKITDELELGLEIHSI